MNAEDTKSDEKIELRTAAIAVWHYWRTKGTSGKEAWVATIKTNAAHRQRIEQFRAELYRVLGARDDIRIKINGGCVEADVEDLRFVSFEIRSPDKQKTLSLVTLVGRCPFCGTETISEPFASLAGLGRMLEKFEPSNRHFCHTG